MKRREILKTTLIGAAGLNIAGLTSRVGAGSHVSKQDDCINTSQPNSSTVTKGYIDGPFGQIHYYQAGSSSGNGPCLILSHQSPTSARMFEKAMPLFSSRGIRAIAVDTPGYGNSDVPSCPPTIPDYATIFPVILDSLGLNTAHFLGHHTGAGILCSFAAKHPKRVKSLILNGPPIFSAEKLKELQARTLGPHPVHRDGSHLQEHWDRRTRFTPGWTDEVAMHRRLVDQLWAGDTSWYGHNAAFHYDMEPDFMALKGRVLILTNTGDDIYDLAKKAHAIRPDFEFKELTGGTHDIVDEQPEAWSKLVADFVLNNNRALTGLGLNRSIA